MLPAALGVVATLLGGRLLSHGGGTPAPARAPDGHGLYDAHCAVCHGPAGKGDGLGASVVRQAMQDFSDAAAMRRLSDRFLFDMIKKGGSQFGRSNAMPAWGMKLSDEEIGAVVAYIRSLASQRPPASTGRKDRP